MHVRDKQLIGSRLRDVLLGLVYKGMDAYKPAQTPLASSWSPHAAAPTAASAAGTAAVSLSSSCNAGEHGAVVRFDHVGSGLVLLDKPIDGRQVVCGGNTSKHLPSDGHVISGGTNWWPVNASLCSGFEVQETNGGSWSAPVSTHTKHIHIPA